MNYLDLPRNTPTTPQGAPARLLTALREGRMHYLEQAAALQALNGWHGLSRAEIARLTGWPMQLIADRMALAELGDGLRAYLMMEGVPEPIARSLLRLPDEVNRRRIARRIVRDRLCIRDAGLLVDAALHRMQKSGMPPKAAHRGRVVNLVRDYRPYFNAIRDIAEQMKAAGVRSTLTEQKTARQLTLTLALNLRHRRTERQSM